MPLLSTFGAASTRSFGGIGAAAAGAGLDIDEAFSTFLYTTDGTSSKTITNNIDLSGEGGLVWLKRRSGSYSHSLYDTERGVQKQLQSDATTAESTETGGLTAFTSTGFTIGNVQNQSALGDMVSWTFRKAPKFFDVVTFSTTTGSSTPITVNHNLGSVPGMIIVKTTNISADWFVFHRSLGSTKYLALNSTDQGQTGGTSKWASAPTSTSFTLGGDFVQNATYVAYLFAHNNSDGEFGPNADQDVIKCGSYTGISSTEISVNLGFEPQWVMIKRATGSSLGVYASWFMQDVMRGMVAKGADAKDKVLYANQSQAEGFRGNGGTTSTEIQVHPNATGFTVPSTNSVEVNQAGETYIYMAIRRGPLAEPTSATDVFDVHRTTDNSSTTSAFDVGFVSDFAIHRETDATAVPYVFTRLLGGQHYLRTDGTNAETDSTVALGYDWTLQNSVENNVDGGFPHIFYNWKRAPSYFDVVAYTGTGSARTVSHNLGVAPEMMWVKPRETGLASSDWWVFHKDLSTPADDSLVLNSTGAENTGNGALLWNSTMPTSSVFSLGTYNGINQSGRDFIAYLFATVAGVSKVGSITGNGTALGEDQDIDCGFSNGARFVLIKRSSGGSGGWYVFDTERGIVAGNDPLLALNNTNAENSGYDLIEPLSSGFTFKYNVDWNFNKTGNTFIFYAIA